MSLNLFLGRPGVDLIQIDLSEISVLYDVLECPQFDEYYLLFVVVASSKFRVCSQRALDLFGTGLDLMLKEQRARKRDPW